MHGPKALFAAAIKALALAPVLIAAAVFAQQPAPTRGETWGLPRGPFAVGFQLLAEQDASRAVTGGTGTATHARPIRIYAWYPARAAGKPLRFGRYAALADNDIWPAEIAGPARASLQFSRGPLARSLEPAAYAALLQRPVFATENARPATGSFPLIVIGQGLYYESPAAFAAMGEFLAGRGFVVASVPLVGTNSPIVRNDAQDLETQIRDLEFAIARLRQLPFVSDERLGVLGFDQGGMAGVVLTMRNSDVDAFASLDSGILYPHASGLPQALASYDAAMLRVPWLHATPPRGVARPPDPDAKSLFDTAAHSNRYLLVTEGMGHEDFTSYALIEGRQAMPGYWGNPAPEGVRRHGIVAEYLADFFAGFLRNDAASLTRLARDPRDAFPDSGVTLEHRTATPPSIGYDEFVQAIVRGDAERAIAELRVADSVDASRATLDQRHLERLAVSLVYTWGLAAEALPVLKYTAERYPASTQAQAMLVDSYVLLEDYAAAIDLLSAFVEQFPNNRGARARLEQLRELQKVSPSE